MAIVELTGVVPVYVEVNTKTGEVVRVVVDDATVRLNDPENEKEKAARAIADLALWPSWEFGW